MKLEDIEKLCSEATPGPWLCDSCGDVFSKDQTRWCEKHQCEMAVEIGTTRFYSEENADAKFIAASRTLMPKLLAVVKESKEYRKLTTELTLANLEKKPLDEVCKIALEVGKSGDALDMYMHLLEKE